MLYDIALSIHAASISYRWFVGHVLISYYWFCSGHHSLCGVVGDLYVDLALLPMSCIVLRWRG